MSDQNHPKRSRMTIDMHLHDLERLKAIAAVKGISLNDLVLICLKDNLLIKISQMMKP